MPNGPGSAEREDIVGASGAISTVTRPRRTRSSAAAIRAGSRSARSGSSRAGSQNGPRAAAMAMPLWPPALGRWTENAFLYTFLFTATRTARAAPGGTGAPGSPGVCPAAVRATAAAARATATGSVHPKAGFRIRGNSRVRSSTPRSHPLPAPAPRTAGSITLRPAGPAGSRSSARESDRAAGRRPGWWATPSPGASFPPRRGWRTGGRPSCRRPSGCPPRWGGA